jgi:hypothetical protein
MSQVGKPHDCGGEVRSNGVGGPFRIPWCPRLAVPRASRHNLKRTPGPPKLSILRHEAALIRPNPHAVTIEQTRLGWRLRVVLAVPR